uniref:Uncharacterized protein n=1 Tax=Arundo donax TaxID=35708 RepID=A0A0A9FLI2_ARUDO
MFSLLNILQSTFLDRGTRSLPFRKAMVLAKSVLSSRLILSLSSPWRRYVFPS